MYKLYIYKLLGITFIIFLNALSCLIQQNITLCFHVMLTHLAFLFQYFVMKANQHLSLLQIIKWYFSWCDFYLCIFKLIAWLYSIFVQTKVVWFPFSFVSLFTGINKSAYFRGGAVLWRVVSLISEAGAVPVGHHMKSGHVFAKACSICANSLPPMLSVFVRYKNVRCFQLCDSWLRPAHSIRCMKP